MNKYIILVTGSSCAGKSTLKKQWFAHGPSTYHVAYDNLKWHLSDYHRDKDADTIREYLFQTFEAACRVMNRPILLEGYMKDQADFDRYCSIAQSHGYAVYCVTLSAPREVLLKRFRDRVASAKAAGSKISITDESLYIHNLENPLYTPPDALLLDTHDLNEDEIRKAVEKHVKTA